MPVSYTHLDVYKRQAMDLERLCLVVLDLSDRLRQKSTEEIIDKFDDAGAASKVSIHKNEIAELIAWKWRNKGLIMIDYLRLIDACWEQLRIRIAEAVNALFDISDHEYIFTVDGGNDGILYAARILVFVNIDLIVQLADAFADFIFL